MLSQYRPFFQEHGSPFFDAWYSYLVHVAKDSIVALFNRSYWRRVWIVQEIQLARSLVIRCGSKTITDTGLKKTLVFFESSYCISNNKEWRGPESLKNFSINITKSLPYKHLQRRNGPRRPLGEWIRIAADSALVSTEPRDYIYALLSISIYDASDLLIDYDKPVDMLYRQALQAINEYDSVWLSTPLGCKFAHLATRMGLGFEYNNHVRTFPHDVCSQRNSRLCRIHWCIHCRRCILS